MAAALLRALLVCVFAAGLNVQVVSPSIHDPQSLSINLFDIGIRELICPVLNACDTSKNVNESLVYAFDDVNNISIVCNFQNLTSCLSAINFSGRCVELFVPGFNNTINSNVSQDSLKDLRAANTTCVKIIVIHVRYTGSGSILTELFDFPTAYSYVCAIAYKLATVLIVLLEQLGAEIRLLYAHSLGCRIADRMSEYYYASTNKTLPCTYNLDPAGPCYNMPPALLGTVPTGKFKCKICFYCNRGGLGTINVDCDVNIIVNDGTHQPGCPEALFFDVITGGNTAACSHITCINAFLFKYALRGNLYATECDSYKHFNEGNCDGNYKLYLNLNETCAICRKGTYYLKTACKTTTPSDIDNCMSSGL